MTKRKEIFKDAGIYAVSSYIAQAIDMVNGILVRRFLGPANMGVWAFLQVIQNYAKHSSLGITTATARDIPYYREKGDLAKGNEIKNLVFTFTVSTSVLTSLVICVIAFGNRHRYSREIFYGLFVVAGLLVLQRIYNLFIVLLRANKEFFTTGFLNIASSFFSLVFTLVLTWKFQLYGFYAAMLLNFALMIALIYGRTAYRFAFNFHWEGLKPLLTLGVAVLITDILRSVMTSIDRLVVTKYLGFEALGIYSVGLMADNYLYSIPNMFGVIFFPHFQEAFAKRDNPRDLQKYLLEPTICLAYFFPIAIGLVWCASSWIVPWVLPQYQSGIPALKLLSLGTIFLAFSHSFSTFLVTIRKHWLLIPVIAVPTTAGWGINLLFISKGWGIEGVALAEGIISALYFIVLSAVALVRILPLRSILRFYGKIAALFVFFPAVLFTGDFLTRSVTGSFRAFVIQFVFFSACMLPVFLLGEKETHIFSTVRQMFSDKFSKKAG